MRVADEFFRSSRVAGFILLGFRTGEGIKWKFRRARTFFLFPLPVVYTLAALIICKHSIIYRFSRS